VTLSQLRARLRVLWNWRRTESELDDEIAFHLSEEADDRAAGGLTAAQARLAAKKDFGNVTLIRETTREVWGWGSAERLVHDVRFAVRSLRRNPGFALVAILTLALGVGPTAAVFGVLDAVVFRPLPVPEPHRLVRVVPQIRGNRWILVYPLFEGLRDQQQSLESIFAVSDQPNLKVRFDDASAPEFLRGSSVSGAYFSTLRLTAAAGRVLTDQDDQIPDTLHDAGCAVVIGHDLWSRRFDNQPSVLGRKVRVKDVDCTIVGVAPVEFRSHQAGYVVDLWVPMRQVTPQRDLTNHYGAFFSGVMGRLREGTSPSQAEAQLTVLYQQLQAAQPVPPPDIPDKRIAPADVSIRVARGNHGLDALQREFEVPLLLIQVLVALVLLIAAASVAGLVLLRSACREAEFATRAALGARRMRIVRQLVTEAGVLAALGGLAGLALAVWSAPVLASFISLSWMPIAVDVKTDWRLLLLTRVATATAALVSGLGPACRLGRQPIISNVGSTGRTTTSRFGLLIARTLVTIQLALSLILVIGTGLLVTTMFRLSQVDPGFRPQNVLVLEVRHDSSSRSPDAADRAASNAELLATYSRVESQLRALPGVEEASLSWLGLFGGKRSETSTLRSGRS
jgi:predicted permease